LSFPVSGQLNLNFKELEDSSSAKRLNQCGNLSRFRQFSLLGHITAKLCTGKMVRDWLAGASNFDPNSPQNAGCKEGAVTIALRKVRLQPHPSE
jgi:hypothetical protein